MGSIIHKNIRNKDENEDVTVGGTMDRNNSHYTPQCARQNSKFALMNFQNNFKK